MLTQAQSQVAYDPSSIVGWSRGGDTDGFVLSPFDIILDATNTQTLPNNFRTPAFLKPARNNPLDVSGFNNLRISGSGQFSKDQLIAMVKYLQKTHKVTPDKLVVVDLREEPHGFINGDAVTWYYGPLSYQQFKTAEEVLESEHQRLMQLLTQNVVIINAQTKHFDGMVVNKLPRLVKRITQSNEEQLAKELGINYVRIPVTDHFMPEPKDVDQFLEFYKTLGADKWLHFKCRGGKGRTTTFMAMTDMLRNLKVNKDQFVKRQIMINGTDINRAIDVKQEWKTKLSKSRANFINLFYDYLHAKDGYGIKKWSDWIVKFPPDTTVTPSMTLAD